MPRGKQITFIATLKSEPKITDKGQILSIADAKIYTELFPKYEAGDRLKISGKVSENGPPGARLAEGGKVFYPRIEKVVPSSPGNLGTSEGQAGFGDFLITLARFRERISQNIAGLLPSREATLLQGTVLGVDNIDRDFRDELVKTGTIHVVVVSGQNLAIVAGVFAAFAKYLGRRPALVLATVAVFLYAVLAGFEPPVVRASIMVFFSTIAIYIGRQVIPIWSLILAALLILFFTPQALFEVSFQLTFAASLGIMTLGRLLSGKLGRLGILGDNAAVATSAYLFTAPIILFYFGRVSPLAPVVNILIAEAIAPIMILGFLIAGASLIFMPLAQLLAYLAYVPVFYFVKVVELFASI